jgi:hypothetical protein
LVHSRLHVYLSQLGFHLIRTVAYLRPPPL